MRNEEAVRPDRSTPLVGRPRGAAWRALQAEGVVWEGQVLLIGDEIDLAARIIVTHRRVAFARGGDVVLDVGRSWLRPAPFLRRDGSVLLSISAPGARYGDPPETVALRMRDGPPAAGHLVAMLAGSGARRVPADLDDIAAAIRPALPDRTGPTESGAEVWPPPPRALAAGLPAADRDAGAHLLAALDEWSGPPSPAVGPGPRPGSTVGERREEPVVRPTPAPAATGRDRDWNLPIQGHLVPRGQRRSRWSWAVKLGGLVALLATAAAFGAGRLPSPIDALGTTAGLPTATAVTGGAAVTTTPLIAANPPAEAIPTGIGGPTGAIHPDAPAAPTVDGHIVVAAGTTETVSGPTPTPPPPSSIALVANPEPAASGDRATDARPDAAPPATTGGDQTGTGEDDARRPAAAQAAPTNTPEPTATPAPPTTVPAPTPAPEPTAPPTTAPAPTDPPEPTVATAPTPAPEPTAAPAPPTSTAPVADLAYAIRLARGGQTLPAFGLPPSPDGNWLVVVVDVANPSLAPATLAVDDIRLRDGSGTDRPVDPSAELVASLVGLEPAWGPGDAVEVAPGGVARLLLLFQIDPAAAGLVLLVGDDELALGDALAAGGSMADLPAEPAAP